MSEGAASDGAAIGGYVAGCLGGLLQLMATVAALLAVGAIFTSESFWYWALMSLTLFVAGLLVLLAGTAIGGGLGWILGKFRRSAD